MRHSEPSKSLIKSVALIESEDQQSTGPADDLPAAYGNDLITGPLKETQGLTSSGATSTAVDADTIKKVKIYDGMCSASHRLSELNIYYRHQGCPGFAEGITQTTGILRAAGLPGEEREAEKTPTGRPSKGRPTEPPLEAPSLDPALASKSCDQGADKEGLGNRENEGLQSREFQAIQQPLDVLNSLHPQQLVEGVEAGTCPILYGLLIFTPS